MTAGGGFVSLFFVVVVEMNGVTDEGLGPWSLGRWRAGSRYSLFVC